MTSRVVKWSKRQYTSKQRALALIPEVFLFLVIIPYAFYLVAKMVDPLLWVNMFLQGLLISILGLFLSIVGFLFATWSVYVQFMQGKGTPAPVMPTQKLIVDGPYKFCRNPMVLGTFLLYLGFGFVVHSFSFILLSVLFLVVMLGYVKLVEEKELEARFGEEYIKYKEKTPFVIPRVRRLKKDRRVSKSIKQ